MNPSVSDREIQAPWDPKELMQLLRVLSSSRVAVTDQSMAELNQSNILEAMALRSRPLGTRGLFTLCFVLLFSSALTAHAQAGSMPLPRAQDQVDVQKQRSSDEKPSLGPIDEEMRVKQSLKLLEKEYNDNVQRAREAAELSAQLRDALKSGRTFGRDETKKLDRLEKLARKIRDEAGGSDEESLLNNPPGKLESALSRLADVAESLYKSLQKTPRQVISASVIENANVLVKLARLTRNLFQ